MAVYEKSRVLRRFGVNISYPHPYPLHFTRWTLEHEVNVPVCPPVGGGRCSKIYQRHLKLLWKLLWIKFFKAEKKLARNVCRTSQGKGWEGGNRNLRFHTRSEQRTRVVLFDRPQKEGSSWCNWRACPTCRQGLSDAKGSLIIIDVTQLTLKDHILVGLGTRSEHWSGRWCGLLIAFKI